MFSTCSPVFCCLSTRGLEVSLHLAILAYCAPRIQCTPLKLKTAIGTSANKRLTQNYRDSEFDNCLMAIFENFGNINCQLFFFLICWHISLFLLQWRKKIVHASKKESSDLRLLKFFFKDIISHKSLVKPTVELQKYHVTVMCRKDELSLTMSWVGCLMFTKRFRAIYLICRK